MKSRGLMAEFLARQGEEAIQSPNLTPAEREQVAKEFSIQLVLDRLEREPELRRRVRKHLRNLPSEKHPGETAVLSHRIIYELVNAIAASGRTKKGAFQLLSRDGLSPESIERNYYRAKSDITKKT
jgi:hypothetical protein